MKKTVLIILAEGFEEIEAVTPIDVLRRAGVNVIVAGLEERQVKGSHGVELFAEILLKDYYKMPDAVVLPGGPGAERLGQSPAVKELVSRMQESGKLIAAICAAPAVVLAESGVLDGKKATCYPGYEKYFGAGTTFMKDRVVTDGYIVTSRGPGTALEFSLELVRNLVDETTARTVAEKMLARV